jgi:hypothetical protein
MSSKDIFGAFGSFCPDCGSILPPPKEKGGIVCYTCSRKFPADGNYNCYNYYLRDLIPLLQCLKAIKLRIPLILIPGKNLNQKKIIKKLKTKMRVLSWTENALNVVTTKCRMLLSN